MTQIATKQISNNINNNFKLSIQVRLDGLSFCILNLDNKEIIWYKRTGFQKEYNPIRILEEIEYIYNTEDILQEPVSEVILLFSHELYSFVPREYFIEEEASNYLKFNTKILKTDVVAHDLLKSNELVNMYIPYTNITNFFFDKYGEYEFKHSISILVQEVLNMDAGKGVKAYLNNFNGYYDLVVVNEGKLLLSNTFHYDTKEDFIYYLLFTAEQLGLDPEKFDLILLGDISKNSPFYNITYTYIKNVEFLKTDMKISIEGQPPEFQQEAFIILKSLGCE